MTRLTSLNTIYKPTTIRVIEPCRKVSFSANNKTVVSPSFGTEGAQKYSGIKKSISKQTKQLILLNLFLSLILPHNQTGSTKTRTCRNYIYYQLMQILRHCILSNKINFSIGLIRLMQNKYHLL